MAILYDGYFRYSTIHLVVSLDTNWHIRCNEIYSFRNKPDRRYIIERLDNGSLIVRYRNKIFNDIIVWHKCNTTNYGWGVKIGNENPLWWLSDAVNRKLSRKDCFSCRYARDTENILQADCLICERLGEIIAKYRGIEYVECSSHTSCDTYSPSAESEIKVNNILL